MTATATDTPSFLQFSDDEEREELASVLGIDSSDLNTASQSQLDAIASHHLRKMGELEAELAERQKSLDLEVALLNSRYARDMGRLRDELAFRENVVKQVAQCADFGKKKSRNVGYGVYGGRFKEGGLRIVDAAAVVVWADAAARRDILRQKLTVSIDKAKLDDYFAKSAEEIPGTTVEEDAIEWYGKPEPA